MSHYVPSFEEWSVTRWTSSHHCCMFLQLSVDVWPHPVFNVTNQSSARSTSFPQIWCSTGYYVFFSNYNIFVVLLYLWVVPDQYQSNTYSNLILIWTMTFW